MSPNRRRREMGRDEAHAKLVSGSRWQQVTGHVHDPHLAPTNPSFMRQDLACNLPTDSFTGLIHEAFDVIGHFVGAHGSGGRRDERPGERVRVREAGVKSGNSNADMHFVASSHSPLCTSG